MHLILQVMINDNLCEEFHQGGSTNPWHLELLQINHVGMTDLNYKSSASPLVKLMAGPEPSAYKVPVVRQDIPKAPRLFPRVNTEFNTDRLSLECGGFE